LLHQFVHELGFAGYDASILYYPFREDYDVINEYKNYNIKIETYSSALRTASYFVVSETLTHMVSRFGPKKTIVWWMSVDNYLSSSSLAYALKNRLNPFRYISDGASLSKVRLNLYQSEYARIFLEKMGVKNNLLKLSDFLNPEFLKYSEKVMISEKKDIVVYNPAKGRDRAHKVIVACPRFEFLPIQNMRRSQVISLLVSAKVYLDLGSHPGKDRIPREAAALGCVILTNQRGSAHNMIDIPIPLNYKIDDYDPNFFLRIPPIILDLFSNYEYHHARLAPYRTKIKEEEAVFSADVSLVAKNLLEHLG